jgi:hypothetical protein
MIDGMKLVLLGSTVETARRVFRSAWYVPFAYLFNNLSLPASIPSPQEPLCQL